MRYCYIYRRICSARLHEVEQILQALNNPTIKLFWLFLKSVLPKFTKLNELFQSASVVLTNLWGKMRIGYQELLKSYLHQSYVHQKNLEDKDPYNKENCLHPNHMILA